MDQLFNYIWSSKRTTTLNAALSQPRQGQHLNPIPGINNIGGNDCWVNSLMQLIATVPSLQNMIFDISRIYLSNTPTVEIKHAALTLKREIVKLTDDRSIKRSISQANSADFRRALQTLLPSLSANEQEDTIEALLGLTGLYELLIKREQEFTGREQGLFSLVTTRHYIPESETKPLEPKLISTLALNVLQRSSTQNLRQFLPGSDKTTPNGLSIEDRKVITRLFPNNPYSFPTLVDSCSSYQQFDRIIFLELVKFEPMLRYLYHSPSGVATEGLLDRKKQVFSNFLKEYFNQKANPSSERCFYYSEQLNAMQSHKLDKITRKIQDQPQEFLFFVQRFNEGMKLKHQFHLTRIEIKIPFFERFTLPEEYINIQTSFELDSFVVHIGESNSGHYISYQKVQGKWFCCNDNYVTECSAEDTMLKAQEAYLLHYKKMPDVDIEALLIQPIQQDFSFQDYSQLAEEEKKLTGLECLNFATSKILETEQKNAEFSQIISWGEQFKEHKLNISSLPKRIFYEFCAFVWIRDGMPSCPEYGKLKIESNPQTLLDPCTQLLYIEGTNLIEQMILKEQESFKLYEIESTLAQLQSFKNAFYKSNTSKTILLSIFYELPESIQTEIIHEIAKSKGKKYAEDKLKEKRNIAELKIQKNILVLKRLYENRADLELLFPGEGIEHIQSNEETQDGLLELINLIKDNSLNKNEYQTIFEEKIDLNTQRKLIALIYMEQIAAEAIKYANQSIVNNIGSIFVKPERSYSILEKITERHAKVLSKEKSLRKEKRNLLILFIESSESLSPQQKNYLISKN